MDIQTISTYFNNVQWQQGKKGFKCMCPTHNDKKPSLHISVGKTGKILVKCHAGCLYTDVLSAVGLTTKDLFQDNRDNSARKTAVDSFTAMIQKKNGDDRKVTAAYHYTDEAGNYLFSKLRIEGGRISGKEFTQIRIINDQKYEMGAGGKAGLYNLPRLLESIRDGYPVFYVEGEKDVEKLGSYGLVATTAGSVQGWRKEYAHFFKGARVIIIPDNDKPGEALGERVYEDLEDYAFRKIIPKLSDKDKGDVSDYLESHSIDEFRKIIESMSYDLPTWCFYSDKKKVTVLPAKLALAFARNQKYVIVRADTDDKDMFLQYKNGTYQRCNRPAGMGMIREWIPSEYQRNSQISETYDTIFQNAGIDGHVIGFEELNANERYINFKNGLYDTETRQLCPHSPDVLYTRQIPYNYDPAAEDMPVFTKYIRDLFTRSDGSVDADTEKIVQEFCGLIISNKYVYRTKKALALVSTLGDSGKSVLLRLIRQIIGDKYVATIPIQTMNEHGAGRFILGTLKNGIRLISNGDQTASDIEDSSYFKELTGGDPVKMEQKGRDSETITFLGGIIWACNGLPSFKDDKGDHLFNRLLIIPCVHSIPQEQQDSMIFDKMKTEIPAIINWMIQGLHDLIDNNYKFMTSEASESMKKEYRQQMDTVYRFINEYVTEDGKQYEVTKNHKDQVSKESFCSRYDKWCGLNDYEPVKRKNIVQRMGMYGVTEDRKGRADGKSGIYTFRGIRECPQNVRKESAEMSSNAYEVEQLSFEEGNFETPFS